MLPWPKGRTIHRIHLTNYGAAQFNPGVAGNARFSPITAANGRAIPTLYGGATFDCAAMETVFHDVPFAAGLKTYDKRKLMGQVHSRLTPKRDIALVDLSGVALKRLGVKRTDLIDTEKDQYPRTRKWAEAIHAACPTAAGLCWVSRQDDSARAAVLFGDRMDDADLAPQGGSRGLLDDLAAYADLLNLADRIGVNLFGAC